MSVFHLTMTSVNQPLVSEDGAFAAVFDQPQTSAGIVEEAFESLPTAPSTTILTARFLEAELTTFLSLPP